MANSGWAWHLFAPARDPDAMAPAALRMADDAQLRQRLVAADLEAAAAYSWEHVRPQLRQIYELGAGRALPQRWAP
jgi:glycosyltransferase involved in cell wall biosynthesis